MNCAITPDTRGILSYFSHCIVWKSITLCQSLCGLILYNKSIIPFDKKRKFNCPVGQLGW